MIMHFNRSMKDSPHNVHDDQHNCDDAQNLNQLAAGHRRLLASNLMEHERRPFSGTTRLGPDIALVPRPEVAEIPSRLSRHVSDCISRVSVNLDH
jgi:hypothetical protein